jgi:hypothetical protein
VNIGAGTTRDRDQAETGIKGDTREAIRRLFKRLGKAPKGQEAFE